MHSTQKCITFTSFFCGNLLNEDNGRRVALVSIHHAIVSHGRWMQPCVERFAAVNFNIFIVKCGKLSVMHASDTCLALYHQFNVQLIFPRLPKGKFNWLHTTFSWPDNRIALFGQRSADVHTSVRAICNSGSAYVRCNTLLWLANIVVYASMLSLQQFLLLI